ncbi:N-acetylglucosamine/diacetylchitobiose ABC transporter substrate-binding protein [soil metagenome]
MILRGSLWAMIPAKGMKVRAAFALGCALALVGCNGGGSKGEADAPESAPVAKADSLKGDLEVVAFKGGYGIDYYVNVAKDLEAKNPGLKVTVSGDPRVWEKLRPRLISGDPPDLMLPGWGMDHWALIQDDALFQLDAALDGPGPDGKGKWRDSFKPDILKLGQKDGKTYTLPYYVSLQGWWYDPGVFAKHGWTPPKTYPELLTLCEKIKAAGIAPITYQGQYPYYMIDGVLMPWAMSVGGKSAIDAAQNLEPGAWSSPAFLKAAQMIDELNKKGYLQKGASGMSHTESQTQFLNGKAAMIPCGTWLETEMKKVMPSGASVRYFLPPVAPDGKGDPTTVMIGVEPWMIPAGAKHPEAAVAFFRCMTSVPVARKFIEEKGTLMAVEGASDGAKLPPSLEAPAEVFKNAKTVYADQVRSWYPAFGKEVEGAMTALLSGELTPQGFVDRCEAAAKKTREDSSIPKYKVGA